MLAFLAVLTAGILIGLLRGGSIANAATVRLSLGWLVIASVVLLAAAQFIPDGASMVAYGLVIVSYATLFAFAGANYRRVGMAFIALGALMNYVVIVANSGMPISAEAAARAGWTGESSEQLVVRGKHFIDHTGDTKLRFLGDIIPLGRAPSVVSVGDLVLWAGMILLIQDIVRGPRGRRHGQRSEGRTDLTAPPEPSDQEPVEHVKVLTPDATRDPAAHHN